MRRMWWIALVLFVASGFAAAQCGGSGSASSPNSKDKDQSQTQTQPESKDKKKKDKKKKDDKKSDDSLAGEVNTKFSKGVAEDLLGQVRDGLEGHMYRSVLRAFDGDKMDGYLAFEDQLERYFEQYSEFRVHFRIADVTVEGNKGVLLVDADLEQIPNSSAAPQRKRTQIRFEMENTKKGWKFVNMSPMNFFS